MLNGFLQYITFESHQAIKHVHYKLNKITPSNITHLLNTLGTTLKIQKKLYQYTQEESYSSQTAMCTALWQRKRAQRCYNSGTDGAETTMCTLV